MISWIVSYNGERIRLEYVKVVEGCRRWCCGSHREGEGGNWVNQSWRGSLKDKWVTNKINLIGQLSEVKFQPQNRKLFLLFLLFLFLFFFFKTESFDNIQLSCCPLSMTSLMGHRKEDWYPRTWYTYPRSHYFKSWELRNINGTSSISKYPISWPLLTSAL